MNNKFLKIALGLALTITAVGAKAQTYSSGLYMTVTKVNSQPVTVWNYFTPDSLLVRYTAGATNFKIISNLNGSFTAILVDMPTASIKKVAVLNPAELKDLFSEMPRLSFTPTTETKSISRFNCKKIIATDLRTKKTYDVWVTKDVTLPESAIPKYYAGIDGFPIQYVQFKDGIENIVQVLTIRQVTIPANSFTIPAEYGRISYNDYKQLSGRY